MAAGIIDELKTLEDTLRDISSSLVDSWSSDDEFHRFCSSVLTLASTPHTGSTAIPSLPDDTPLHDLVQRLIEVLTKQGSNNLLASSSCHHQSQFLGGSRGGYTSSSSSIIITSPHWRALHTRLGTQRMADLLMYYSIFMPLHSNGCYIQLTGCPLTVSSSVFAKQKSVSISNEASSTRQSKPVTKLSVILNKVFHSKSMMYDKSKGSFFNTKCVLNQYHPSNKAAERLGRLIFGKNFKPKLSKALLPMLRTMISNHRSCRYNALMIRYCCMDDQDSLSDTPHHKVILFVRAAVKHVFTQQWFGTQHNAREMLKAITKFITLRATETMTLQQMINGIKSYIVEKISHCQWIRSGRVTGPHQPPSQSQKQLELFCQLVVFLIESYVIPLVKHFYYVTERSRSSRNHLFYYEKRIWSNIEQTFTEGTQSQLFTVVDIEDGLPQLVKSSLSVSSLRLQPKSHGVRPIISFGGRTAHLPNGETVEFFPIGIKLKQIHSAIQHEQSSSSHPLGCSSVNSFSEIYNKWKSFVLSERAKPMEERDYPCHFFVTVDIKSCYDTIDCNKMLNILSELFTKSSYQFRRMSAVPLHNTSHTPTTHMIPMGTDEYLIDAAQRYCDTHRVSNVVLVDQGKSIELYRSTLLKNLNSHLRNHVIKHGGQYLLQHTGIPQGSVVSPLLCGIYLTKMEEECFPTEFQYAGLLMRMVDDYLFVTDMPDAARDFLEMMSNGLPDYNCTINTDKTVTNFIIDQQDGTVSLNNDMEWFPWCGLLFNVRSLDVRVDYTRYLTCSIRDTVSIVTHSTPFSKLLVKTILSVKIRCSPILLDTQLLSVREVMKNVYENYLLTAMKFHINVEKLHIGQRANSSAKYFMMVIIKCGTSFYHSAKTCFTKLRPSSDRSVSDGFTLSRDLCSCLCVQGFVTVLHKKQSRYTLLLRLLRARLRNKMRHLDHREKQLMNDIVQDTAKDHVMRIKY